MYQDAVRRFVDNEQLNCIPMPRYDSLVVSYIVVSLNVTVVASRSDRSACDLAVGTSSESYVCQRQVEKFHSKNLIFGNVIV